MNRSISRPSQVYIALTAAAGTVWLAYLVLGVDWGVSLIGETALFILLILLAGSFPLHVAPKVKADLATAVLFGAAILLDSGAAALTAAISVPIYTYLLRFNRKEKFILPWYKYPFNAAVAAIYVGLASVSFHELNPDDKLLTPVIMVAALVMFLANTALVTMAASLQIRMNPFRFWWMGTKESGPAEIALMGVGILGALAYREHPAAITLVVVPAAVVYLATSGLTRANGRLERTTERLERANTQLEQATQRLKELQGEIAKQAKLASIGAISLDIAHQIKNPLAILMGRLESTLDCLASDHQCFRYVQIATNAGERIKNLTDSFTSIGRQKPVELYPCELLAEACGMAQLLSSGTIEIRWEHEADLPHISGNPILLREALSNVYSNAMEAMDGDGSITTSTSRENGYVVTRITDDGCGVPREIMERLFEPFQSTKPDGSGLGLFAAKHIVEMHRGKLEVDSREGQGTRVTIALPVHPPQAESELVNSLDGNGTPPEGPLVSTED
jgi:signal transduction histidine kinase